MLDFEGTSLYEDREATEIGLIALDLDLNEIGRFESVVNPFVAPTSKALEIAGLTLSDLRDAPRITEIWPNFAHFFSNAVLVMHNEDYDLKIVENNFVNSGLLPKLPQSFCTLKTSRKLLANRTRGNRHDLDTVCEHFGIVNQKAHTALSDAQAALEVLLELIEIDETIHDELIRKANNSYKVTNLKAHSRTKPRSQVRNAPNPIPAGSVRKFTQNELKEIAREIKLNSKVEYVNLTGELRISTEQLDKQLRRARLYYKETPTTLKTAFLIYGSTGTGGSKVEKAQKYKRPIILEEQVSDLIELLTN